MNTFNWQRDLSDNALTVMRDMGNFGPTSNVSAKEVKGYMIDAEGDAGKTYYTSDDLREIAAGCVEVAEWLDKRADERSLTSDSDELS